MPTKFSIEYFIDKKWETWIIYYYKVKKELDLETDWRFKEVPGKRRNCKILYDEPRDIN